MADASAFQLHLWTPAAMTLAGWAVINWQNNRRETRKEGRSTADNAKKLAKDAASIGIGYWQQRPDNLSWQVKAALEELEVELSRFPGFAQGSLLMNQFVKFDDAITGDDFESAQPRMLTLSDPLIKKIIYRRNMLLAEIEREFKSVFL